jgi:uncharacterized protein YkwD
MFGALLVTLSLHLAAGLSPATPVPTAPDTAPNSSWQQVSPYDARNYDVAAERELFERANAERARFGLAPLKLEQGLVRAARAHAARMAGQNQLSHQFAGEPALVERISANSTLHLERAGENVAVAPTIDQAHGALMSSPPHRDNVLNARFNVAGFGAYRRGSVLYVAQDFASSSAVYSLRQAQELVAASVEQVRSRAHMPRLERINDLHTESSACAMAQADSLGAAIPAVRAYTLRYTSMQPEQLPANISEIIARRGLRTYSAGSCYARTARYPNGAYWVVLVLY